jgi:flagellar hook assembly protein FlgD
LASRAYHAPTDPYEEECLGVILAFRVEASEEEKMEETAEEEGQVVHTDSKDGQEEGVQARFWEGEEVHP